MAKTMKANPRIEHFCRRTRSSCPWAGTGRQTEEVRPARQGEHGPIRGPRRWASTARATGQRGESKATGRDAPCSRATPVLRLCLKEVTQKEGEKVYIHASMCRDRQTQIPTATNRAKGLRTVHLLNPHNHPMR